MQVGAQAQVEATDFGDLGVYIHYPWCRKRCPYCDFAVALAPRGQESMIPHQAYLDEVLSELAARAPEFTGRGLRLVSIYVGGGTPSLWPAAQMEALFAAVRRTFDARDALLEVTIEANPTDCTAENLPAWRAAGVTRVSLGCVQSIEADELATLGRDHCMGDGSRALAALLDAGFASVSADVIAGTPGGSGGLASARALAGTGVPHLSVYELTLEEGTPLTAAARRGDFRARDDDELAALYQTIDAELGAAGYQHYEISSYARPGHRAVHNSLYWRGCEYLGLGVGAASFRRLPDGGGVRSSNPRATPRYMRGERAAEIDALLPEELAADLVWLGLRTSDGVAERALAGRDEDLKWLLSAALVTRENGRIRPTLRGFLYSDQVARRLVGARR